MIRDEQEIRDALEAMETMYIHAGLAGHEVSRTDPRIQILRWVLMRDELPTYIDDIIKEWRTTEREHFSSMCETTTICQQ